MAGVKSAISFGLVHIPISMSPVINNNDTSFNMLHKKCENRIKYLKYCPKCKKEIKQNEIIRGFEYSKDDYIILSNEELNNLKVDNDKTIEIISFVDLSEIDPIYFEKSYYLTADTKNKAYALFKEALKKEKKVAIAKTVIGSKFYYVVLRFGTNNIIMNTLYFSEELREVQTNISAEFTKKELELALKLINSMTDVFKPEEYVDEYQTRIKDAIDKKIAGKEIKPIKMRKTKTVTDLMTALKKSIKEKKIA